MISGFRMLFRNVALALVAGVPALLAQVTVIKTIGNPTPIAGGGAFNFTLTVTSPPGNLRVVDPLPPGTFLANGDVAVTGSPLSCSGPALGENGAVICENAAYPGGASTIVMVVQAEAGLAGGVRTNTARAVNGPLSGAGSVGFTIINNAVLTMTKAAPAAVNPGENITYQIRVTNSGSSSAINVSVGDILPAGTTFVSVQGTGPFHDGCSYLADTNSVYCFAGRFPSGTHDVNLVVKTDSAPPSKGSLTNTATLAAAVGAVNGSPASATTVVTNKKN
jgi:uncharacterized repeat protein (TIGR01451 family)